MIARKRLRPEGEAAGWTAEAAWLRVECGQPAWCFFAVCAFKGFVGEAFGPR